MEAREQHGLILSRCESSISYGCLGIFAIDSILSCFLPAFEQLISRISSFTAGATSSIAYKLRARDRAIKTAVALPITRHPLSKLAMFRLAKTTARLNGRVAAFGALNLPRAPVVTRQWSPYITQRASFATKKDDKADPPPPKQPIDHEEERRIGERKLEARPDQVSVASSTSNNLKTPIENTADGPIMQAELKHDMVSERHRSIFARMRSRVLKSTCRVSSSQRSAWKMFLESPKFLV